VPEDAYKVIEQRVPTMLTIENTAKYFNMPKHFVRKAVMDGKVVHVRSGSKVLINMEKFAEWLSIGDSPPQDHEELFDAQLGVIRRLA